MVTVAAEVITAIARLDPLRMAIVFVGLIGLGALKLAAIVIKSSWKDGSK